ncbi:MAG: hypothetical protein ACREC5_08565 [Thermoplasmata archaeon]
MTSARYALEISVERPDDAGSGGAGRVRLTARMELPAGEEFPREEVARLLRELRAEMDRAVPARSEGPPGPDRSLPELLEAYRPRQPELVELLREEGELREGEYRMLREHLASGPASRALRPTSPQLLPEPAPPTLSSPLAAAPAQAEPAGPTRPVPELLERYQIESLKQAGAVRARRQISFDEYMALKRHFGASSAAPGER